MDEVKCLNCKRKIDDNDLEMFNGILGCKFCRQDWVNHLKERTQITGKVTK